MSEPRFHVALIHPEIGPNAGNAGRLCLGVGARLHLVHPLGFQTDEKAVRRAGLDYWKHVDVVEHASLAEFLAWRGHRRLLLFSARGDAPYTAAPYEAGDVLVFGRESVGLPDDLIDEHGAYRIPLESRVRSLNLSNAVAVVAYQAWATIDPGRFAVAPVQGLPGG